MDFEAARARLIEQLRHQVSDEHVLGAMGRVPRERFIPSQSEQLAYEDTSLPIGCNQTISQPYIVAVMTRALTLVGHEKVLEVGTGSGYQAAILAELARKVISVERVPELARSASELLSTLGYVNVDVHLAEESLGWPQEAPYDGIIVTAAAPEVPSGLVSQLRPGGRLVIPVGTRYLQELCLVTRGRGRNTVQTLGGCRFVPLIGKGAWEETRTGWF